MAAYFGNETQQRLQARATDSADIIDSTPGACQAARMMGCDDVERFGWERIDDVLVRDGTIGFRLIPEDKVQDLRVGLADRGYRFDTWDVYLADQATAVDAARCITSRPLPTGLIDLPQPTDPLDEYTTRIQSMMAEAGVVPFGGAMLTGKTGRSVTVAVGDDGGSIVATAHGYLPHNIHSPFHHFAWGGLVAVAERFRGRGLGNYVNARMIECVFEALDATHIYELVSASNAASIGMVRTCGLRPAPHLVCGIATPEVKRRFTR